MTKEEIIDWKYKNVRHVSLIVERHDRLALQDAWQYWKRYVNKKGVQLVLQKVSDGNDISDFKKIELSLGTVGDYIECEFNKATTVNHTFYGLSMIQEQLVTNVTQRITFKQGEPVFRNEPPTEPMVINMISGESGYIFMPFIPLVETPYVYGIDPAYNDLRDNS
jgi:hypothetical protein